jgi:hypothetical protein
MALFSFVYFPCMLRLVSKCINSLVNVQTHNIFVFLLYKMVDKKAQDSRCLCKTCLLPVGINMEVQMTLFSDCFLEKSKKNLLEKVNLKWTTQHVVDIGDFGSVYLGGYGLKYDELIEPKGDLAKMFYEDAENMKYRNPSIHKNREHMLCRFGRAIFGYDTWLNKIRIDKEFDSMYLANNEYINYFCHLLGIDGLDIANANEKELAEFSDRLSRVPVDKIKELVAMLSPPPTLDLNYLKLVKLNKKNKNKPHKQVVVEVTADASSVLKASQLALLSGHVSSVTLRLQGEYDEIIKKAYQYKTVQMLNTPPVHHVIGKYIHANANAKTSKVDDTFKSVQQSMHSMQSPQSMHSLENATIVFSGVQPSIVQVSAIVNLGARITMAFSGKTTLLVTKDVYSKPSSAQIKAIEAGIKVMKFSDFVTKFL